MTELQMGLFGLGAAGVVGVLAYNKWNEYKHRKLAEQLLSAQHTDVLLHDAEPGDSAPLFTASEPEPEQESAPGAECATPVVESSRVAAASGERIEPVFRIDADPAERQEPRMALRQAPAEPEFSAEAAVAATPAFSPAPVPEPVAEIRDLSEPDHLLSPVVDYVASFEAVEAAPG